MDVETRSCANPDCGCTALGGDDYCKDSSLVYQSDYDQPLDAGTEKNLLLRSR